MRRKEKQILEAPPPGVIATWTQRENEAEECRVHARLRQRSSLKVTCWAR